ncbi:hypothetical protein [Microbacterium sp. NPDC096154]|uniref:hypothetical protein n=1 Tax=Microbacterium sp. NPDC096154 TaxID=3155549 RepID=UPI003329CBAC
MTLRAWSAGVVGRAVHVSDLIDLATIESDDPHALLTAIYEWKYQHASTAAKATAGAGSAAILATVLPILQTQPIENTNWPWLVIAWVAAGVLVLAGGVLFGIARRLHAEFVAAQALLSELVEVRTFIRRYRAEGQS